MPIPSDVRLLAGGNPIGKSYPDQNQRPRARAPAPHGPIRGILMSTGTIESIHIAPAATAPTLSVKEARAIPGVGLEGDRYALRLGTFFKPEPAFELTLIEAEA